MNTSHFEGTAAMPFLSAMMSYLFTSQAPGLGSADSVLREPCVLMSDDGFDG